MRSDSAYVSTYLASRMESGSPSCALEPPSEVWLRIHPAVRGSPGATEESDALRSRKGERRKEVRIPWA